jgi:hypothetical protein
MDTHRTRRAYLAICGSVAAAGCTALDSLPGRGKDGHPFTDRTVAVQISNAQQNFDHLETLLGDALSFWNANTQYLPYTTTLEYRPDASDPDILVEEVLNLESCGLHEGEVSGCAELIQAGDHDRLPATATVEFQEDNDWRYQRIIEHEIGHTLGLEHDDEPARVMHESWEQRYPEFETRLEILDLTEQRRATYSEAAETISGANDAVEGERYDAATEQFRTAITSFEGARGSLQRSEELVGELSPFEPADMDRLASLLSTEKTYADAVLDSLAVLAEASEHLAAGENSGVEQYNNGIREYNETLELEVPDMPAFVSAVGFSTV